MSEWAARRFWDEVAVQEGADGFAVLLDDRSLRTPAKAMLVAPTAAMAERIADEWRAQSDTIDPNAMPFTRSLNATLDKVAPDPAPVVGMIAAYAETDLLCYRAEQPKGLVERQAQIWDPMLDWAEEVYGARLAVTEGVIPVEQPPLAVRQLGAAVEAFDPFAITALHDLVTLSGSLILGLAGLTGRIDGNALFEIGRLDELWQIEHWGADEEAEIMANAKKDAILHALAFEALARANA